MSTNRYAVIVAGGKGLRMNSDLPKQFMELKGTPVLMRTLSAFFLADDQIRIIVVLPVSHQALWKKLIKTHKFEVPHQVVSGGASRFQSVRNGLEAIRGDGLVAIHDGVRPLVSAAIINSCYEIAGKEGSAVPVVPSKDSLRLKTDSGSQAVERSRYVLVQTPQTFQVNLIRESYAQKENNQFTDDASVFEAAGNSVCLVEGDYKNLKITTPGDITIAECLMEI